MNPNINLPSVRIGLVRGDPAPVWRKTYVVIRPRHSKYARWLSAAVKPSQLRKGRAFSCLGDQNLLAGNTKNSPVHPREVQHVDAQGVRLAAQYVASRIESLCDQRLIPQVKQVAWLRIGRVRAGAHQQASFLRIQRAQEDRVIFKVSAEIRCQINKILPTRHQHPPALALFEPSSLPLADFHPSSTP